MGDPWKNPASDEALKAIETIQNSGINNFSIDLIYGIPEQTIDSWKKTLSKAVELSPHTYLLTNSYLKKIHLYTG